MADIGVNETASGVASSRRSKRVPFARHEREKTTSSRARKIAHAVAGADEPWRGAGRRALAQILVV